MATHWTYDATAFGNTTAGYYTGSTVGERYQIRLLIQDTNTARQLFQDEEIDWTASQEANVYMAAAALADALVAKAGSIKSKKISEFAITYDVGFYRQLASLMRSRGYGHQVPYAGGISVSDKERQQQDSDATTPAIVRNIDENPAAPKPDIPSTNPLTTI